MTSKSIPSALQAHYDTGCTTTAFGLRITRTDSDVFAFTSHDRDVTISAVNYLSAPGLSVTSVTTTAGLAVDNLELSTLDDGTVFTRADVLGGVWAGATFVLFRYNWGSPSDGIETLLAGTVGEIKLLRGQIVAELRGLQQALQQPVGATTSQTCRTRLGSTLCTINLATYPVTGTLTSVTSNLVFRDSARTEALDYFTEGTLTWTGGNNVGLSARISGHLANGTFTLAFPMLQTVQVGDTYSVHAGCRKRFTEDCVAKFSNALNFQGEPHAPAPDDLTSSPEVSA